MSYRSSLAKFLVNRLSSPMASQINHVYTWVYIIELFARSQALLHRNRFPMAVLKGAINTSNRQHLLFTSSAMIRFISLNLSVSESATDLELRLPRFNYESCALGSLG